MIEAQSLSRPQLLQSLPVGEVFDCLLDTVFFVKDAEGRYVLTNDTLASRFKLHSKQQLVGMLPSELIGRSLGARYEAQDCEVLETGERIVDRLELHIYPERKIGWCLTNKFPICDTSGKVVGVVGISKDLGAPQTDNADFERLQSVVEFTQRNLASSPTVEELAALANMTAFQLDRRIRKIFGLTTGLWVLRQRLDLAQRQLMETNKSIAEISLDAGYEDQSAFARQFRKTIGLAPSQFRKLSREKN